LQVGGQVYQLAKYRVDVDGPRPESYIEDYQLAQQLPPDQVMKLSNLLNFANIEFLI
jgi:hypothetical protein